MAFKHKKGVAVSLGIKGRRNRTTGVSFSAYLLDDTRAGQGVGSGSLRRCLGEYKMVCALKIVPIKIAYTV